MNAKGLLSKKSFLAIGAGLGGLALAAVLLIGRANFAQSPQTQATPEVRSLIDDWTMRHFVYPETSDVTVLGRLQQDPRWWIKHLARRPTAPSQAQPQ